MSQFLLSNTIKSLDNKGWCFKTSLCININIKFLFLTAVMDKIGCYWRSESCDRAIHIQTNAKYRYHVEGGQQVVLNSNIQSFIQAWLRFLTSMWAVARNPQSCLDFAKTSDPCCALVHTAFCCCSFWPQLVDSSLWFNGLELFLFPL